MKHLKNIVQFGLKFAMTSLFYNLLASDGTGDTNINLPSYGTNSIMPRSDNAFDDAVNYHSGEVLRPMGQGIDDDLDISTSYNSKNSRKNNALMIAVLNNNIIAVQNALENKDDVNYKNADGQTALHYAAANDNNQIIRLLLQSNAQVNVTDKLNRTPLHFASQNNCFNAAIKLMQYGADATLQDNDDKTAIDYAQNDRMRNILDKDSYEKNKI